MIIAAVINWLMFRNLILMNIAKIIIACAFQVIH